MQKKYKFFKFLNSLYRLGLIKGNFKAHDLFYKHAFELMTKTIPENLDNHIWFSLFMQPEIIHSMNIPALESDTMGAYLCTFGHTKKLLDYVEQNIGIGLVCAYHKALIGALHEELIPPPKAIIINSSCCDSVQKLGNYLNDTFGCELFILDTPAEYSIESLNYVKNQLIEMTSFLSKVMGATFSMERLKETVRLSNSANYYWKKALDLRIGKPLFAGVQTIGQFISFYTNFGTEVGVEIAKSFYEELLNRTRNGTPDLEDRCRLMWVHNMPAYKTFFDDLEREIGASVVVEVLSYPYFEKIDEDDPFLGIADKILSHPILGVKESTGQYMIDLARRFRIDGVIQLMHMNCRGNYGFSPIMADALAKIDVPILFLEMDALDNRYYSEEQAKLRVQGFVESILNRKE